MKGLKIYLSWEDPPVFWNFDDNKCLYIDRTEPYYDKRNNKYMQVIPYCEYQNRKEYNQIYIPNFMYKYFTENLSYISPNIRTLKSSNYCKSSREEFLREFPALQWVTHVIKNRRYYM